MKQIIYNIIAPYGWMVSEMHDVENVMYGLQNADYKVCAMIVIDNDPGYKIIDRETAEVLSCGPKLTAKSLAGVIEKYANVSTYTDNKASVNNDMPVQLNIF